MIRSKVQPFPLLVLALAVCTMSVQRPGPASYETATTSSPLTSADTLPQTRLHIEVYSPDGIAVTNATYDVFRSEADGSRTLLRTGRAKFNAFEVELDAEPARYVLLVQAEGYLRKELPFWSEVADISHDITLLPDPERGRVNRVAAPRASKTTATGTGATQPATPSRPKVPVSGSPPSAAAAVLLPPPPPAAPAVPYKLTDSTTLRGGPGHETRFILRLHRDYEVQVLDKTNGKWWKIRYQDKIGYVPVALLRQ